MPDSKMNKISADELSEPEQESKIKSAIKIFIALFLIVLMTSFLIPEDILAGIAGNSKIQNKQITTASKTVLFSNSTYEKLVQFYITISFLSFSSALKEK